MFKRIIREMKLSLRKNPSKIVLLFLVLIVSSNMIFSGILLNRTLRDKIETVERLASTQIKFEYIDESKVSDNILRLTDHSPIVNSFFFGDLVSSVELSVGGSSFPLFESLTHIDDEYSKRKLSDIESLGLFPNSTTLEVYSDYGFNYLTVNFGGIGSSKNLYEEHIKIIEGRNVKEDESLEIIISDVFAKNFGIKINEEISLTTNRKIVNFTVVGIYTNTLSGVNENVMFSSTGSQWEFTNQGNHYPRDIFETKSYYKIRDDAQVVEGFITELNNIMKNDSSLENIRALNMMDDYSEFIDQMNTLINVIYLGIVIVSVITVYLITSIIKKDIKVYQTDIRDSIYEDDKSILKVANLVLTSSLALIVIVLSLVTTPALNYLGTRELLINQYAINQDGVQLSVDEFQEIEIIDDRFFEMSLYHDFDRYALATLDFNPNIKSTIIFAVILFSVSTLGTTLGNKSLNKKE